MDTSLSATPPENHRNMEETDLVCRLLKQGVGMRLLVWLIVGTGWLSAATLEQLSLDEMIQKSTGIVGGMVTDTSTELRGPVVYTRYRVRITQRHKGAATGTEMDVFVPGGRHGALTQTFPGSPTLAKGQEYLLFLWAGRSGMSQVIGLSQGLFDITKDAAGEALVVRRAAQATVVDSSGKLVEDTPVSLRLREMVDRIQRTLAGGSQQAR
jgi:hypothetical protein